MLVLFAYTRRKYTRSHAPAHMVRRTELTGLRGVIRKKKRKKNTLRLAVAAYTYTIQRGWEKECKRDGTRERKREKSQGWNGAGRRPLIKILWHIAVCYTNTTIIRMLYTICEIHTFTYTHPFIYAYKYVCVCTCVPKPIDLISAISVNR